MKGADEIEGFVEGAVDGVRMVPVRRREDEAVLIEFMREYYLLDDLPFDAEQAASALSVLLGDAGLGRVWIVQAGGEPVGYAVLTFGYSLEYHGRDAFIDELFIRNAYRSRGIGRWVIRQVEAECRKEGVRTLHLEVERKNAAAQSFYRGAGFQDHDRYLLSKRIS